MKKGLMAVSVKILDCLPRVCERNLRIKVPD